jgi:hypothetical protein
MFVIGNGESRLQVDLNFLKTKGKVYGCNALHRDFAPDALIAVDGGMMHEIGASGYIYNNLCYFRSWSKLPEYAYDSLVQDNFFEGWHDSLKTENDKGHFHNFVMTGTDPNQIMRMYHIIKQGYEERNEPFDSADILLKLGSHHQWITWVEEEDNVRLIPEPFLGWSAGPIAVRMLLEDQSPEEIYLIGFDMKSDDGLINNVYKGTNNYAPDYANEIPSVNWKKQHAENFVTYPDVVFYHVSSDAEEIDEWGSHKNIDYLTFDDLKIKLDIYPTIQ